MPDVETPSPASAVRVLLGSDQDWFASSLRAVLEPEGYVFVRVRTAKTALNEVAGVDPDIMIVDEGLPDIETTSLVAAIRDDVLSPVVPILSSPRAASRARSTAPCIGRISVAFSARRRFSGETATP